MLTRLLTSAVIVLAIASPAMATDFGCQIKDTSGNDLTYVFADKVHTNGPDASGTSHGSVYEVGFIKNGVRTISPPNLEPVWNWSGGQNGISLSPEADPAYSLQVTSGSATLNHGQRVIGDGICQEVDQAKIATIRSHPDDNVIKGLRAIQAIAGIFSH